MKQQQQGSIIVEFLLYVLPLFYIIMEIFLSISTHMKASFLQHTLDHYAEKYMYNEIFMLPPHIQKKEEKTRLLFFYPNVPFLHKRPKPETILQK